MVLDGFVRARASRNEESIKNRQPISRMYVKADFTLEAFYTDIIREELNVKEVVFTDDMDRDTALKRSYHFSKVMPWLINREITGALMLLRQKVDGIVMISAYPCGPDALVNDMLVRKIKDVPVLQLTLDAQNGTAGVETRLESFMDIIQYQKAGGYGNKH